MEEHVYDLLPGYALGSLDEDELLRVARHLPRCRSCRVELETFESTADQLGLAAPEQIPPPELKAKLMARIKAREAAGVREPAHARAGQKASGGWWSALLGARPSAPVLGLAAAVVMVVLLAVSNLLLWSQLNQLQARLPGEHVRLVSLAGTQDAPGAQGYLMVFADEPYGTLVVEDAPQLEPGYQYQLWLIRDGKRTSGGVFSVDEHGYGTLQVDASQPLESYPAFGVTIEPAGGSPGPTGKKVLGGDL